MSVVGSNPTAFSFTFSKGGIFMQTNPVLVLILASLICIGTLVFKFLAFDVNGDHGMPDTLATLIILADTFKDILFVSVVLYYFLYGVI